MVSKCSFLCADYRSCAMVLGFFGRLLGLSQSSTHRLCHFHLRAECKCARVLHFAACSGMRALGVLYKSRNGKYTQNTGVLEGL